MVGTCCFRIPLARYHTTCHIMIFSVQKYLKISHIECVSQRISCIYWWCLINPTSQHRTTEYKNLSLLQLEQCVHNNAPNNICSV